MSDNYLVFSANWQEEVAADSYEDAVEKGTYAAYRKHGELFSISKTVVACKARGDLRSFDAIAVLEDLSLYYLSKQVRIYLGRHK